MFRPRIAKDFTKFNGGGLERTLREPRFARPIITAFADTYSDWLSRWLEAPLGSICASDQTPAVARMGPVFDRRSSRSGTRLLGDNTTESLTPGGSPAACRLNSRVMRDSTSTISI